MKNAPRTTPAVPAPHTATATISSDRPAKLLEQDRYGLKSKFIPRLARLALDWPTEDGLVIGLFGPWGIGKTSILNMFRDYVEQGRAQYKYVRVASFNPWFYEDSGALVASFFATIAEELKARNDKVLKAAEKGFKGMGAFLTAASKGVTIAGVNLDIGKIAEGLKDAGEFSSSLAGLAELADGGEKKLEQHRLQAEKALKSLGEKGGRVVVLIDDVDRLNKIELLTMLRLIRTVADLPCMTLVVAMDDERVRDVLEKAVSEGYGQGFIDKIIQVPLHVPLPEREAMVNELVEKLKATLEPMDLSLPSELTPTKSYRPHELDVLSSLIQTPRDLARYINGFRMLLLAGDDPDVHPTDAAIIEAVRIFYPDVYNRIRRKKAFLTESAVEFFESSIGFLDDPQSREHRRSVRTAELNFLVRGGATSLSPETEESIKLLLKLLFGDLTDPSVSRVRKGDAETRRIRSPDFFDNYFRYAPPIGTITRREVVRIVKQILNSAEAESEDGIAGVVITALQDRDGAATERVVAELGYGISSVRSALLGRIGKGILKTNGQLPQDVVLGLLESVLANLTDFRRLTDDQQSLDAVKNSFHEVFRSALMGGLPIDRVSKLFGKLITNNPWMKEERFRELAGMLLQRVVQELQIGSLLRDQVTVWMSSVFKPAVALSRSLGESSPVSLKTLQMQLIDFVNSHPEILPQVLYAFGADGSQGPVLMLSSLNREEVSASLRAVIGDYELLRPSYEKLKEGEFSVDSYRQILRDFGMLLADA